MSHDGMQSCIETMNRVQDLTTSKALAFHLTRNNLSRMHAFASCQEGVSLASKGAFEDCVASIGMTKRPERGKRLQEPMLRWKFLLISSIA